MFMVSTSPLQMLHWSVVPILVTALMLCSSGAQSEEERVVPPELRLAEAIRGIPRFDRLQTTFTVDEFAPSDVGAEASNKVLLSHTFDLTVDGVKRHIVEHLPEAPAYGLSTEDVRSVWDGQLWRSENGRGEQGGLAIDSRQPHDPVSDCWALFHGIDMFSMIGQSLEAMLDEGELIAFRETEDQLTFRFWMNEQKTTRVEVVLHLVDGNLLLRSLQREGFGARGTDMEEKIASTLRFTVDEWATYGEHVLPKVATRELTLAGNLGRAGGKAQVGRTVFRRQSARIPAEGDEAMIFPRLEPEDRAVNDRTLRCAYTPGSTQIFIDGHLFRTRPPITGLVRESLSDVVGEPMRTAAIPPPIERGSYLAERAVLLSSNAPATVIATVISDDDQSPPPAARCVAPEGVKWEVAEWRLVYGCDVDSDRPARWQSLIRLSSKRDDLPRDSIMEVHLEGHPVHKINLTGRP